MAIYGYTRVSTQAQADEGESLEVQQRQIFGWCRMQALHLDQMFVERGVSGGVKVHERARGGAMWKSLQPGDMVIAAKLDRLFRSALDALQSVEELKARGVSLILLDLGGDISGNGLSKLFLTIAAAFAEAERDRIRERVSQTKKDQKDRGRYLGGKIPFGYRVADGGLVKVPGEQAIIAEAVDMRSRDMPLRTIQAEIADRHGRKLSLDAVSRIVGASKAKDAGAGQ
jgi:DNA invertase Pin-like site-specific DNA recombinase